MQGPVVEEIRRVSAIAGQTQINARIKYPGTHSEIHGFVGTVDGHGPIVVISPPATNFTWSTRGGSAHSEPTGSNDFTRSEC